MSHRGIIDFIGKHQDLDRFRRENWTGTFADYLELVQQDPLVTRNAYERLYDMIVSHGVNVYELQRGERRTHYCFFDDPFDNGRDAVYGLDEALESLVNALKSAAKGYGIERRVLLLHGPVGSSKSTIVRLLKKGLERYSASDEGALYTLGWVDENTSEVHWCPMNEEPLHLLPPGFRAEAEARFNAGKGPDDFHVRIQGDLDPFCRFMYEQRLKKYGGDWTKVIQEVRVRRSLLSEKDRIGIGTFQPKDEKNQDSTELTGDINYRKIAELGSDSDPRAFNFDGEFNIANRGIIEFIEMLKLDVAFLYDLLGASQEHKIKPKKFAQTDIDEVIIGHSVAADTPIAYRYEGHVAWATIEQVHERFAGSVEGLEVLAHDFASGRTWWTPVRNVFRHRFDGRMLTTSQKWGVVETTPNHSIYDRQGQTFYPDERHEVMAVRDMGDAWLGQSALDTINVAEGIAGFVCDQVAVTVGGGKMTRPCRSGWTRLDLPRHATSIRAEYDPITDVEPLKDLLSVLVWYATEGHVNGRNGGIVISQAARKELERIQACYQRISTGRGSIDAGAKTDTAWRLYLGSQAIARLAQYHCGERSTHKRLPDFLFRLPSAYLEHVFNELMRTDGSRRVASWLRETASDEYCERYFDYKTLSPMLAAQVGTLASLLGYDYSVFRQERAGGAPAYRIRYCSGAGKRGGRHTSFEARLHERAARADEWVYDIECIGLHNFVCGVGNVVCHNTNEPEYRRLQNNEFMEALRDRTVKIDIPYVTRLSDEIKIYEKDYNAQKVKGKHIAPHTIEMAAMWAVLTRLEEPKNAGLTLLQKLKLYNGKTLPGFTEENIKELRSEAKSEGMMGISPRYVQDKISNALVAHHDSRSINPFMVMNELESGLKHHSLLTSEELRSRYRELLGVVKEEYENIVKNEVQRAIAADEDALKRLCANYIDNVKAYTQREKVKNKFTGQYEEPDERLMRSIEEKIDIPESRKDDFRREIMNYIGALSIDGKTFDYRSNERLYKALQLKLFEDQKDSIKLTSLVSNVVDQDTQAKIDVVKARLIRDYGYDEESATDVLNYVASIFARGDTKDG